VNATVIVPLPAVAVPIVGAARTVAVIEVPASAVEVPSAPTATTWIAPAIAVVGVHVYELAAPAAPRVVLVARTVGVEPVVIW
jgi:hypothetical protein